MENIDRLLEVFLQLIKSHASGSQVQFSVNHAKNEINITNAPCGFLRKMYANDKIIAHQVNGGIVVQMFK